jgi:hypothetical protein
LLAIIGSRQYEQWQNLRHLDPSSTEVALRVERLCENICKALQQRWLSPKERQEAEARRAADEERLRQDKHQEEARRVAEEGRRRQEAEAKRRLEEAEVEKRRQDNERRKRENEAAWAEKKARVLQILWRKTAPGAALVALLLIGGIWLYRTMMPASVTSPVMQPERQTAENVQARAKEETKQAEVTSAGVQIDKQNVENPKISTKEQDPQQAAMQALQEFMLRQAQLATLIQNGLRGERVIPLGLGIANLTNDLRRALKIKDTVKGVLIIDSPMGSSDANPGDVITGIGGSVLETVASTSDVQAKIDKLKKEGAKAASLAVISAVDREPHLLLLNIQ